MNFSTKAPQEDPAIKAQREAQQRQADAALTSDIQRDLQGRTRARLRRFGFASQSVPVVANPNIATMANLMRVAQFPGLVGSIGRQAAAGL